jgi:hypothetical protein
MMYTTTRTLRKHEFSGSVLYTSIFILFPEASDYLFAVFFFMFQLISILAHLSPASTCHVPVNGDVLTSTHLGILHTRNT